jgi:branched-chain amino acid transport system substrate-binding protein
MTKRSISRSKRVLALAFSVGRVAAACGSDDDGDDGEEPAATEAPAEDDGGEEEPADTEAPAEDDGGEEEPADTEAPAEDDGGEMPSGEATGEPIKIGVQNLEGDPAGSFPEFLVAIEAAAEYVNAELNGLGGRPIELVECKMVVTPDDSQRCANEISAEGVELAISTINFFGNHYDIYQGTGIPVVTVTPITIADFITPGVYSVGAGGGCLGVHTGMVEFATGDIEGEEGIEVARVGVPWADTPPGVVCYNDLEAKPLDVINGSEPGESERAGEKPDLEHIGVPIAPASPDVTPQATEVLDFDPDVIIYSAQGSDCWNLVDALGRLGWTPDDIPLVLSGACTDFTAMEAAGDLIDGIYLTGQQNGLLVPPEAAAEGDHRDAVTTYQTKGLEYGMTEDDLFKGFATQGFSAIMNMWELANTIDGEVTGESIAEAFAATDGTSADFGGAPLDCSGAPEPYIAVCGAAIAIDRWNAETQSLETVVSPLNGIGLVAGTELRPGG